MDDIIQIIEDILFEIDPDTDKSVEDLCYQIETIKSLVDDLLATINKPD